MRATKYVLIGLVLLALSFAGCTGNFNVKQTEPLRIEVNGQPGEARVAAPNSGGGDADEKQEFRIESPDDVETIQVIVEVRKVESGGASTPPQTTTTANATTNGSSQPTIVLVIVEDADSHERLDEQRVEADEQSAKANMNIHVKGHDNVVIVTQAVQGVADVNVAATSGSGDGTMASSPAPTTYAA